MVKRMAPHPDYTCNGCGKRGYKISECFDCIKKNKGSNRSSNNRDGSHNNYGRN